MEIYAATFSPSDGIVISRKRRILNNEPFEIGYCRRTQEMIIYRMCDNPDRAGLRIHLTDEELKWLRLRGVHNGLAIFTSTNATHNKFAVRNLKKNVIVLESVKEYKSPFLIQDSSRFIYMNCETTIVTVDTRNLQRLPDITLENVKIRKIIGVYKGVISLEVYKNGRYHLFVVQLPKGHFEDSVPAVADMEKKYNINKPLPPIPSPTEMSDHRVNKLILFNRDNLQDKTSVFQLDCGTIFHLEWRLQSRLYVKRETNEVDAKLPAEPIDRAMSYGDAIYFKASNKVYKAVYLNLTARSLYGIAVIKIRHEALITACQNGHLELAKLLYALGADPCLSATIRFERQPIHGVPALWVAAAAGHLDLVRFLVEEARVDINQTTDTKSSALRGASIHGHLEIVKYLVEKGADMELGNCDGHTPLMVAALKKHTEIVQYLLSMGASPLKTSNKGNTALHDAARSDCLQVCQLLISAGAPLVDDAHGVCPLMSAAMVASMNVFPLLIDQSISNLRSKDAHRLLGCTLVDEKRDLDGAVKMWTKAIQMQLNEEEMEKERLRSNQGVTHPIFTSFPEVLTMEQLEEIKDDSDKMRMQALVVREKILGEAHTIVHYYLLFRGDTHFNSGEIDRGFNLVIYRFELQQKHLSPLHESTIGTIQYMYEICTILNKHKQTSTFQQIENIFTKMCFELERYSEWGDSHLHEDMKECGTEEGKRTLVYVAFQLIVMADGLRTASSVEKEKDLYLDVRRFVNVAMKLNINLLYFINDELQSTVKDQIWACLRADSMDSPPNNRTDDPLPNTVDPMPLIPKEDETPNKIYCIPPDSTDWSSSNSFDIFRSSLVDSPSRNAIDISPPCYDSDFQKKYEPLMIIGQGGFGVVFAAQNRTDKWKYAVKRISLKGSDKDVQKALEEVRNHASLTNEGIVGYNSSWLETPPAGWQRNEDKRLLKQLRDERKLKYKYDCVFLYIQMELCKQSLSQWLEANEERDLAQAKIWFKQIVSAVAFLHERNKIHRDLKPCNILFDMNGRLKICDLGLVTDRAMINGQEVDKPRTVIGTLMYMPSEQIRGDYDSKVDVYSLGLILVELCVRMTGKTAAMVFKKYQEGTLNVILRRLPEVDKIVSWLTNRNPKMRPTCNEILEHSFLA